MLNMVIRDWISGALRRKGEFLQLKFFRIGIDMLTSANRFGWVNASYVYGLQIVNAHMRRALGTLTPYDTFVKALEDNRAKLLSEMD